VFGYSDDVSSGVAVSLDAADHGASPHAMSQTTSRLSGRQNASGEAAEKGKGSA
jgi:hypothetical protein